MSLRNSIISIISAEFSFRRTDRLSFKLLSAYKRGGGGDRNEH